MYMMKDLLERLFHIKEYQTTIKQEIIGGFTTFVTMSYIIFVQPQILAYCGMDSASVMVATCIASALACFIMGIYANYPIALAPGMGHNTYFAFIACPLIAQVIKDTPSWQIGLGIVFIAGIIFILLSILKIREILIETIPPPLRYAIASGIGMLIALLGFQWSGITTSHPQTFLTLGNLNDQGVIISILGLLITSILIIRKIRGAILLGIIITSLIGISFKVIKFYGIISPIPSLEPTFLKLKIPYLWDGKILEILFIILFLDIFDTVGTLIGIGEKGGFIKNNKLPRAQKAMLSDASSTVIGSLLGTSTITSYVESAAGIVSGAKTGLANIITGILFLVALFFKPLVLTVAQPYQLPNNQIIYPVIAPVLIIVGCMMMSTVTKIAWETYSESIPAFLTITVMPFTGFRITEGIAFGLITYIILNLFNKERQKLSWITYLLGLIFLLRYIFVK